ncbi:MAG: RluA family pseudouridine synthase [Gemmataceae bacterium]
MLSILYEDYHVVAVNKPAPMLTQAPQGVPSLEAMVKAYVKEKYAKPAGVYLGIPHRLDRPVSGVVLFARNTKAARHLAQQFQAHAVEKVYWAAVQGEVVPAEGEWQDWLRKLPEQARSERVEAEAPGGKIARLRYRTLQSIPGGTLLEISPQTGRMHQIRVQAAVRGHAVFGDEIYGATIPFGPLAELPRERLIGLHARGITFMHPIQRTPMTVTAPLSETWKPLVSDPG